MLRLDNTKLYTELTTRLTENSKYYSGFLFSIENDISEILQFIKNLFPDFPDHGLQHSLRIMEYIGKMLNHEQIKELSDLEIFIFILASFFHDTGMVLYKSGDKEKIRKYHHKYSKKVIESYFETNLKNLKNRERIKNAVIFTCEAHGLLLNELINDNRFSKIDTISYDDVRFKLLAFLLRIGDLMDLEGERANNFRLMIYNDYYSQMALDHNNRHNNVNVFRYSSTEIFIEVEVENIQQYKIWNEWFSYLEQDILHLNTFLKETKINFPLPKTNIVTFNGEELDIQDLRFEIDEKGGIWEIISNSIYTNELDFVRELIQNAIDATLKKIYINKEVNLDNVSPRSWEVNNLVEPILVAFSENSKKLYVIDHGIGMSVEDLQNFLFKVSSSGYIDNSFRDFNFPGIAQYGIGFVSCLINAEKISIYTSENNNSKIHHVTMESDLNVAFIQNISNNNDFMGTVIELDLKSTFTFKKIEEYLRKTFFYTSVEIKYINMDVVHKVAKTLNKINDFELVINKPFLILNFIYKLQHDTNLKNAPLMEKKDKIIQYERNINDLIKFIIDNYYTLFQEKKLSKYNMQVNYLKKIAPSKDLKEIFPDLEINEKQHLYDENIIEQLLETLNKYTLDITVEKGKLDKQLEKFSLYLNTITSKNISIGDEWKYLAIFLNSEFDVYDIQYSMDPIDLMGKTGVILFKHSGQDFQHGIEYVAINGFLFENGNIYNRLSKFLGYTNQISYNLYPEVFIFGSNNDFYDIRYELEEYLDENDMYDHVYEGVNAKYDVIYISNNDIVRLNNKNVFNVKYNNKDNDYINLYDDIVRMNKIDENININAGIFELDKCLNSKFNFYYQDGIAIQSKLNNLFPVGLFRIICNCTADARMKLNVTRHELSEIRNDVETWINNTGIKIQEMILNSLVDMLKNEKLDYSLNEMIIREGEYDYFSELCCKTFKDILKRRKID